VREAFGWREFRKSQGGWGLGRDLRRRLMTAGDGGREQGVSKAGNGRNPGLGGGDGLGVESVSAAE